MKSSILIVDRHYQNGVLLTDLLQSNGYDVRFSRSGEDALAQMKQRPASLVFLDQHVPGVLNGELLPALRILAPFVDRCFNVRFVATSGNLAPINYERAGFSHVLQKPFDFQEVERVLADCAEPLTLH